MQINETQEGKILVFNCPHCAESIEVLESMLSCCIFRHAAYKENMQQINPHAPKEECDSLIREDRVFGCAKPFQIVKTDNQYAVIICEYI